MFSDNNPVPRSAISFDSSEIATAEHETFYNAEMPEICLRDGPVFDSSWGIHQPPPYSQDMDPISFVCGMEGKLCYHTCTRTHTHTVQGLDNLIVMV